MRVTIKTLVSESAKKADPKLKQLNDDLKEMMAEYKSLEKQRDDAYKQLTRLGVKIEKTRRNIDLHNAKVGNVSLPKPNSNYILQEYSSVRMMVKPGAKVRIPKEWTKGFKVKVKAVNKEEGTITFVRLDNAPKTAAQKAMEKATGMKQGPKATTIKISDVGRKYRFVKNAK